MVSICGKIIPGLAVFPIIFTTLLLVYFDCFFLFFLIVLWIILVLETQVRRRRNHCSLAAGRRTYSPGSICDCECREKSSGGLKGNLQCQSYLIQCANPYVALFAVDILYIYISWLFCRGGSSSIPTMHHGMEHICTTICKYGISETPVTWIHHVVLDINICDKYVLCIANLNHFQPEVMQM